MIGDCYEQAHAPLNEPVELYPNLNDYVEKLTPDPDPFDNQVGGNHYTTLKIQPMEYSMANNLDACQHTIIKYVTRFRQKNGLQDLYKAKHTLEMLIAITKAEENSDEDS